MAKKFYVGKTDNYEVIEAEVFSKLYGCTATLGKTWMKSGIQVLNNCTSANILDRSAQEQIQSVQYSGKCSFGMDAQSNFIMPLH